MYVIASGITLLYMETRLFGLRFWDLEKEVWASGTSCKHRNYLYPPPPPSNGFQIEIGLTNFPPNWPMAIHIIIILQYFYTGPLCQTRDTREPGGLLGVNILFF